MQTGGSTSDPDPDPRAILSRDHPAWTVEGETAVRTLEFPDFAGAVGFVVSVALLAERADHHPDIDIRWNRVTLRLTTHSAGALTRSDTALVAEIDELMDRRR